METSFEFDAATTGEYQPQITDSAADSGPLGSVGLSLSGSLQDTSTALIALHSDVDRVAPLVHEMLSWLDDVLDHLRGLSDPHARNAENDVRSAQSSLREALTAWIADYLHRNEELRQKLAS